MRAPRSAQGRRRRRHPSPTAAASTAPPPTPCTPRPPAARSPTPASTARVVDGFASAGLGTLAPVEVAEYLGLRPTLGGLDLRRRRHLGGHGGPRGGRDRRRARQRRTARLRLDRPRRHQGGPPHREPLLRRARPAPVRGPVRPHPDRQVRDGRPPPHARVRHDAGAARRGGRPGAGERRRQPGGDVPRPDHRRRRTGRPDDRRPVHQAALLHPLATAAARCCWRPRSTCRTLPRTPVWVLGTGEHVSHTTMSEWDDFTVSPAAVSGRLAFERAGVRPAEIDIAEIYDAFTYMTLVTLEDLGFCAKGEGGAFVEKGRLTRGRRAAGEHRRRRPVGLPPGDARAVPAGRGGTAAARRGGRPPGPQGRAGGCRSWPWRRGRAAGSAPRGRSCWAGARARSSGRASPALSGGPHRSAAARTSSAARSPERTAPSISPCISVADSVLGPVDPAHGLPQCAAVIRQRAGREMGDHPAQRPRLGGPVGLQIRGGAARR